MDHVEFITLHVIFRSKNFLYYYFQRIIINFSSWIAIFCPVFFIHIFAQKKGAAAFATTPGNNFGDYFKSWLSYLLNFLRSAGTFGWWKIHTQRESAVALAAVLATFSNIFAEISFFIFICKSSLCCLHRIKRLYPLKSLITLPCWN